MGEDVINSLSWEEFETFERTQDGEPMKLYRLRPLLARFMVDANGATVAHDVAMKQLAKVPMANIKDVVAQFMATLQDTAVPKASGGSSKPPSEVEPQASPSPAGLES